MSAEGSVVRDDEMTTLVAQLHARGVPQATALMMLTALRRDDRAPLAESCAAVLALLDDGASPRDLQTLDAVGLLAGALPLHARGVSPAALVYQARISAELTSLVTLLAAGMSPTELSDVVVADNREIAMAQLVELVLAGMPLAMVPVLLASRTSSSHDVLGLKALGCDWDDIAWVCSRVPRLFAPMQAAPLAPLSPAVRRMAVALAIVSRRRLDVVLPVAMLASGTPWGETLLTLLADDLGSSASYRAVVAARTIEPDAFPIPLERPRVPVPPPAVLDVVRGQLTPRPGLLPGGLPEPAVRAAQQAGVSLDALVTLVAAGADPVAAVGWVPLMPDASLGFTGTLDATHALLAHLANQGHDPAVFADLLRAPALGNPRNPAVVMHAAAALAAGLSPESVRILAAGSNGLPMAIQVKEAGATDEDVLRWMSAPDPVPSLVSTLLVDGVPPARVDALLSVVNTGTLGLLNFYDDPIPVDVLDVFARHGLPLDLVSVVAEAREELLDSDLPLDVLDLAVGLCAQSRFVAGGVEGCDLHLSDALMVAAAMAGRPWAQEVVAALTAGSTRDRLLFDLTAAVRAHAPATPARRARLTPARPAGPGRVR